MIVVTAPKQRDGGALLCARIHKVRSSRWSLTRLQDSQQPFRILPFCVSHRLLLPDKRKYRSRPELYASTVPSTSVRPAQWNPSGSSVDSMVGT